MTRFDQAQDVQRMPLDFLNRAITESEWRGLYRSLARVYGWHAYHTSFSMKSDPGYPDDHFWHPTGPTLSWPVSFWVEAKTEKGKLRPKQIETIDSMRAAGLIVRIWRPSDWDEVVEVLSFGRARAA